MSTYHFYFTAVHSKWVMLVLKYRAISIRGQDRTIRQGRVFLWKQLQMAIRQFIIIICDQLDGLNLFAQLHSEFRVIISLQVSVGSFCRQNTPVLLPRLHFFFPNAKEIVPRHKLPEQRSGSLGEIQVAWNE